LTAQRPWDRWGSNVGSGGVRVIPIKMFKARISLYDIGVNGGAMSMSAWGAELKVVARTSGDGPMNSSRNTIATGREDPQRQPSADEAGKKKKVHSTWRIAGTEEDNGECLSSRSSSLVEAEWESTAVWKLGRAKL